jgi:hypothetical protein
MVRKYTRNKRGGTYEDQIREELSVIKSHFKNAINATKTTIYKIKCAGGTDSELAVSKNEIQINYLAKCGSESGTKILEKIISISEALKKRNTNLLDVSTVDIEVVIKNEDEEDTINYSYSLAHFSILRTGISWYNKFGFISDDHDENVAHNYTKRNMPLQDFIKEANSCINVDNFVSTFKVIMPDVDRNTPITLIVQAYHAYHEREPPNAPCIELMEKLIDSCKHILEYNDDLNRKNKVARSAEDILA